MGDERSSSIRTLDVETFDLVVGKTPTLVLFYAPWCGHSQRLMPTIELLATTFHKRDPDEERAAALESVPDHSERQPDESQDNKKSSTSEQTKVSVLIARVNVDNSRSFAKRFDLRGFPTVKYFAPTVDGSINVKDKGTQYAGDWDASSLVQYVNERAGTAHKLQPAFTWVRRLVPKVFEAVALDPTRHVLVQFHAPWCVECGSFANTWDAVAKTFRSDDERVVLASVDAEKYRELAQQEDVTSYPTIKYYPGYVAGVEDDPSNDEDVSVQVTAAGDESDEKNKDGLDSRSRDADVPEDVGSAFARTYNGGMSSQELVTFINDVAGLERVVSGDIHREAGRSKILDEATSLFVAALSSGRKNDAKKVMVEVEEETDRLCGLKSEMTLEEKTAKGTETLRCQGAHMYGRVMSKVLAHVDGVDWTRKELKRLEKMIKDEDVNHVQRTTMMLKRNVMEAFQD